MRGKEFFSEYLDFRLLKRSLLWVGFACGLIFLASGAYAIFLYVKALRAEDVGETLSREALLTHLAKPHLEDLILPGGREILGRDFYPHIKRGAPWTEEEIAQYWQAVDGIDVDAIQARNRDLVESMLQGVS